MILEKLQEIPVKDYDSLVRYVKHIEESSCDESQYYERHHILPKSMFKQYEHEKWNIVNLSYKDHCIAHILLHAAYQIRETEVPFNFMKHMVGDEVKLDDYVNIKSSFVGDANPSKRIEVRNKISKNKTGKKRKDMVGKSYFGSDEETVKRIREKNSKARIGKVLVKDANGKCFTVPDDDPRWLSGELVSINKDRICDNHYMKDSEKSKRILDKRKEKYSIISQYSLEQMVDYLVKNFNDGKSILNDKGNIKSNFSYLVKLANLDKKEVTEKFLQRLSKDTER